jgi:hypothetical protein
MDSLPISAARVGEMPSIPSNEAPVKPVAARSMSRRFARIFAIEFSLLQ